MMILGLSSGYTIPLSQNIVNQWFYQDIEESSTRILNATQSTLINNLENNKKSDTKEILTQSIKETNLFALGVCYQNGVFFEKTENFPESLDCKLTEYSKKILYKKAEYFVRSKSLFANKTFKGQIIIVYKLDFIYSRNEIIRKYILSFFALLAGFISLGISLTTLVLDYFPYKEIDKSTIPSTKAR